MDLVLQVETIAPSKPAWHNPDSASRAGWSQVYEIITTWFCSSHDFNHDDNIYIQYNQYLIKLEGQTIRYLGPSLRSAASLVSKAFDIIPQLEEGETMESTPGIFVTNNSDNHTSFSFPYHRLKLQANLSSVNKNQVPQTGTLFTYDIEKSQEYYAPGSRIAQGLVWYLQERSL